MRCITCNKVLETTRGAAFEITGFEQDRAKGGTNHVLWRERTGRVMCPECVVMRKHTGNAQQMELA